MRPFRKSTTDGPGTAPVTPLNNEGSGWDIRDVAEGVANTPSTYHDDLLIDEDGKPTAIDPETSRTGAAAVRLGGAAGHTTTAAHHREAGTHHADGVWFGGAYVARQGLDESAANDAAYFDNYLNWLRDTPSATRPKSAKTLSLLAKPMFLTGDIAVIFNILNKSGANLFAALFTGVSAATGAVALGTTAGHNAALAYQRERRGPKPDNVPNGMSDLYSDGDRRSLSWIMWLAIAAVFSVVLGAAVALITLAGRYPANEALGNGFITALTVVGSFGAEAYSTNAAADRIESYEAKRDVANGRRAEIGDLLADADRELITAKVIHAAGSQMALAARETTMVVTDPPKSDERIRGYEAPESAEDLAVPTSRIFEVIAPPDVEDLDGGPSRATPRPGPTGPVIPRYPHDQSNHAPRPPMDGDQRIA
jgi:hypothetical protein